MKKSELISKIADVNFNAMTPKGSSAVIIPLIEVDGDMHILFEERSHKLSFQPGDVCFPGGGIEEGETPREAAVREFREELCLGREGMDFNPVILAALAPVIGPAGRIVFPFAALIEDHDFNYSKEEVERIFTYPVSFLKEHSPISYHMQRKTIPPADFPYEKITGGNTTYNWHVQEYDIYVYVDTDPVIWGFTGRVLHDFLEKI